MLVKFKSEKELNDHRECDKVTEIQWDYTYDKSGVHAFITNQPNIDELKLNKYPNLRILDLYNFTGNVLDLSGNPNLEELYLYIERDENNRYTLPYPDYEQVIKKVIFNDDCKLKRVVLGPVIFTECHDFIKTLKYVENLIIYGGEFHEFNNCSAKNVVYDRGLGTWCRVGGTPKLWTKSMTFDIPNAERFVFGSGDGGYREKVEYVKFNTPSLKFLNYDGPISKSFDNPNNFLNIEELTISGNKYVVDCSNMPNLRKLKCFSAKNINNCNFLKEIFLEECTSLELPVSNIEKIRNVRVIEKSSNNYLLKDFRGSIYDLKDFNDNTLRNLKSVFVDRLYNSEYLYEILEKLINLETLIIGESDICTFDFRKYNIKNIILSSGVTRCVIYHNSSTMITDDCHYNTLIADKRDELEYKFKLLAEKVKNLDKEDNISILNNVNELLNKLNT